MGSQRVGYDSVIFTFTISSNGWWEPQSKPLGTTVTPALGLIQVAPALLPCSYPSLYISVFIYRCVHAQLCPTLCKPMDCNPPGSSVHGILQARILEWIAISSRVSSQPRDLTCVAWLSSVGRWILYHLGSYFWEWVFALVKPGGIWFSSDGLG